MTRSGRICLKFGHFSLKETDDEPALNNKTSVKEMVDRMNDEDRMNEAILDKLSRMEEEGDNR